MNRLTLFLAAALIVASFIVSAQPKYPSCPANPTTSVDCSLTTAPDLDVDTSTAIEWVEKNKNPIVVTIPAPPNGSSPYPNLHAVQPYDWQSCGYDASQQKPTQYSITCTNQNNKKIYGHIIIKPIENGKKGDKK
jgi:hypothetical protein